jgi:hypothetical protein
MSESAYRRKLAEALYTRVCDHGRNLPFDEIVAILAAALTAEGVVDPETVMLIPEGIRLWDLREQLEQERVQHAGCLTAAEGHAYCQKDAYGWSPAGQAAADLREEKDKSDAMCEQMRSELQVLEAWQRGQIVAVAKSLKKPECPVCLDQAIKRLTGDSDE